MRFNFRKITSVIASLAMLGSTIGIAAAANYPAPFVSGGKADVAVVVGASAASSDFLAAVDVGQSLQVELAKQTATTTTSTASATGGDSVNLASSSQNIYMNSSLSAARTILTKDHLTTTLADGSAYDSSGTEYKYSQKITMPAIPTGTGTTGIVTLSKSGESMDPAILIDTGYSATTPFYNYTLTFSKQINVSNANVIGTATVKMQGVSYTVGANSDADTLYLYGSGQATTVNGGETKTVTVDAKDHTVLLVGTSSTTTASVEVDGIRKSVTKGSSYKYGTGGDQIEVYIKDIFHAIRESDTPSIDVLVGAKTLHLENAQTVRYGADDTSILNTRAEVIGSGGTQLTSVSITQGWESATGDYLKAGGKFKDRVLGGVEIQFADVNPALDSTARDTITIDTDNSVAAKVAFTSYLAGDAGEKSISYARDGDQISDSALGVINLVNAQNKTIHVLEGANATVGQWIIVNDNDEGRIFEIVSVPAGSGSGDYVGLKDVITNEDFKFTTGYDNSTTTPKAIGGAQYYAAVDNRPTDSSGWTVNLTWGPGAAAGTFGTQRTLFPRIKLKSGEWITFLTNVSSVGMNATATYSLPGAYLWTTYRDGVSLTGVSGSQLTVGSVIYNFTNASSTISAGQIDRLVTPACIFNKSYGPAILIQEEKTLKDTNGQSICIPLTSIGTTTTMPAIGTPTFSDTIGSFITKTSDTYTSQAVDLFGTLVERNVATGTNYKVTVKYPDDQMIADILVTGAGATVTAGGTTGTGTGVTELGSVTVKDSEVSQVKEKNLLVIGGSCINAAAQKILGKDAALCGADFTADTGVGADQALLKVVKNPYLADDTKQIAMLVAGYEAADTTKAVAYVTKEKPSTVEGSVKLSTESATATVVKEAETTA